MSILSEQSLIHGRRDALLYYMNQLHGPILVITDTQIRSRLYYSQLCREKRVLLVKHELDISSGRQYFQMIPKFDFVLVPAEVFKVLTGFDYFSYLDFKFVIIDDVFDYHVNKIPVEQILKACIVPCIGMTTVSDKSCLDELKPLFPAIKKVAIEPLALTSIHVTTSQTFGRSIQNCMGKVQSIIKHSLKGVPFSDYDYGTVEYENLLREMIDMTMQNNQLALNYAFLVLEQYHQAYIMSSQDEPESILEFLEEMVDVQSYYEDGLDGYSRSEYSAIQEDVQKELENMMIEWKNTLHWDAAAPRKIVKLLGEVERSLGSVRAASILIVTTSSKTVSRLHTTLAEWRPSKIQPGINTTPNIIERMTRSVKENAYPVICTREWYTLAWRRYPDFINAFGKIFFLDGLKTIDRWKDTVFFTEEFDPNPPRNQPLLGPPKDPRMSSDNQSDQKRKFDDSGDIRDEEPLKRPKQESPFQKPPSSLDNRKPSQSDHPIPLSTTSLANEQFQRIYKRAPQWEPKHLITNEWQITLLTPDPKVQFIGSGLNQTEAKERASAKFIEYAELNFRNIK